MRFTTSQSAALSFARAMSAQMVLVGHLMTNSGFDYYQIQNLGVVIFFLMSGLLITRSVLDKSDGYSFSDYLIDRGSRIFVPYVPAVFFILAMGWMFQLSGPMDAKTTIGNLLMLENYPLNYFSSRLPHIDAIGTGGPLGSVAMEWWFYMGAAALYFGRKLPIWSCPLILLGLFLLTFNMITVGVLGLTWVAGAIIGYMLPLLRQSNLYILAAAILLQMAIKRTGLTNGNFYDLQFMLVLAMLGLALLKAVEGCSFPKRIAAPIAFVADYSYSLYLTHYTILATLYFIPNGWVKITTVFLIANIVAIVMWFLFERHYHKVGSWIRSRLSMRPRESSSQKTG